MNEEHQQTDFTSEEQQHRRYHRLEPFVDKGKMRSLRNLLNIVFIVGCVVGMAWYFYADRNTAIIILIVASVFKFAELILRILRL